MNEPFFNPLLLPFAVVLAVTMTTAALVTAGWGSWRKWGRRLKRALFMDRWLRKHVGPQGRRLEP